MIILVTSFDPTQKICFSNDQSLSYTIWYNLKGFVSLMNQFKTKNLHQVLFTAVFLQRVSQLDWLMTCLAPNSTLSYSFISWTISYHAPGDCKFMLVLAVINFKSSVHLATAIDLIFNSAHCYWKLKIHACLCCKLFQITNSYSDFT